jgi:hypothetical protein
VFPPSAALIAAVVTRRLLALARDGLLESDLIALLRRPGEAALPSAVWAGLFVGLRAFLRVLPSADTKARRAVPPRRPPPPGSRLT